MKSHRLEQGAAQLGAQAGAVSKHACFSLAVVIASAVYVFALSGGDPGQLKIAQGAIILWAIALALATKETTFFTMRGMAVWLVLGAILSLSVLLNTNNYPGAGPDIGFVATHVVGILGFVFVAQWIAANVEVDRLLRHLAFLLTPFLVWAIAVSFSGDAFTRLTPLGLHPNWWGEVAFALTICALAMRQTWMKALFSVAPLVTMVAVQSRGALLASVVAIVSYWLLRVRPSGVRVAQAVFIIVLILILGIAIIFYGDAGTNIGLFVQDRILLVNDPYRGLGTGLTGRIDQWSVAFLAFSESPLYGQGLDTFTEVHNGFLRFASEGGLLLLGAMIILIFVAMGKAWRHGNHIVFSGLLGIIAYMMTYPRALNMNLVGLIFLTMLLNWRWHTKAETQIDRSEVSVDPEEHEHRPVAASLHERSKILHS